MAKKKREQTPMRSKSMRADSSIESSNSRPQIVCICGSGRFWNEIGRQRRRLTLEEKIVVGPEVPPDGWGDKKVDLDVLHFRKIDLADEVLVVDIDTQESGAPYTGLSTNGEIAYAQKHQRPITRLSDLIRSTHS